jgi:transcriptional regulator with XRE-family HTH domain
MIGERIKQVRKALRIKQIDMAKALNLNPSAISQMESGPHILLGTISEIGIHYQLILHC